MTNMNYKEQIRLDKSYKIDYEKVDGKLVIYNVPITGEIVQDYSDHVALKSYDEIKKIDVKNIPITFLHPNSLLEDFDTKTKAKEIKGIITKNSNQRTKSQDDKKLYCDMIITDRVDDVYTKIQNEEGVDVSIGFTCINDYTPGKLDGKEYDVVQRDITLDHLAILLDNENIVHQGRASFEEGYGIGNDSKENKKIYKDKVANNIMEKSITTEDNQKAFNDMLQEKTALQTKFDSLQKEHLDMKEKLQTYIDQENKEIDSMRGEIVKKFPAHADAYKCADNETIKKVHSDMKSQEEADAKKKFADEEDKDKKEKVDTQSDYSLEKKRIEKQFNNKGDKK